MSFNALLKSIEEPPPHVVFMMATTELEKIPETVLSRSQVFEFKTISSRQIADQLRTITQAEKISVDEAALLLIARSAEGSMRDAQSALDQVIAFAGQKISADDVATVLGLVGRDLVLDIVTAVADETPAAAFELSGRAVELGYDLRLVFRELSRVVRDLLVLSVDPSRIDDPEIAQTERGRVKALAGRFSREDLLRAFDLLSKAEFEIRGACAAEVSPRDGAAAMDSHAQARAADRAARGASGRRVAVAALDICSDVGGRACARIDSSSSRACRAKSRAATAGSCGTGTGDGRRRQGCVPRRNPQDEGVLLQHRRRAGAEDRVWARSRHVHVFAGPQDVARAARAESPLAGIDRVGRWRKKNAGWRGAGRSAGGRTGSECSRLNSIEIGRSRRPPAMTDAAVQAMLDVFPAEIEDVEEI